MSIRIRLILALGALLIATIGAMITGLLVDAQRRVQDEVGSSMRMTETLLRSSLGSLEGATDVRARVAALVASLQGLRHVEITLASGRSAVIVPNDDRRALNSRLAAIGRPKVDTVVVPVVVGGRKVDDIMITAETEDELEEVWETIGRLSWYALGLAVGGFALTSFLINSALSPVHDLGRALHRLEEGDYNVAAPTTGPPEIAAIGAEVNALAAALQRARDENRRLSTDIIRAQDDERQDVARELHDELGPYLFAVRASGSALRRALLQAPPDVEKASAAAGDVESHIDALQATNRRVLQHLSPIGLDELGLAGALKAIVAMWRKQQPRHEVALSVEGDLADLDRVVALTGYRVVQEGLTNAFRHADAKRIDVVVRAPGAAEKAAARLVIRVSDDGIGLAEESEAGFGLRGMRERVTALGGSFSIVAGSEGGTTLHVKIP